MSPRKPTREARAKAKVLHEVEAYGAMCAVTNRIDDAAAEVVKGWVKRALAAYRRAIREAP